MKGLLADPLSLSGCRVFVEFLLEYFAICHSTRCAKYGSVKRNDESVFCRPRSKPLRRESDEDRERQKGDEANNRGAYATASDRKEYANDGPSGD